jgi:hypothetical protein
MLELRPKIWPDQNVIRFGKTLAPLQTIYLGTGLLSAGLPGVGLRRLVN